MKTVPTGNKSKLLEEQEWYIGLLTTAAIESHLKKDGDFVVRTSEKSGALEFVVSVRMQSRCLHYTIFYDDYGGWALILAKNKTFKSVVDLITHYQKHRLPGGCVLKCPVKRPKWYLKHENLSYDLKNDLIGTGNFCDVYRGRLNVVKHVAIKICHGPNGTKKAAELESAENAKEMLIKEGSLMAEYKHPNIIKFYGICCDRPPVCVVMEECSGGSLLSHLLTMKNKISVGERVRYTLEAATGMSYLQDKNCIHRDLAARNCLISKFGIIKISDFGLSKVVTEMAGEKFEKQQIPLRWMAPETLKRDPEYSVKSDVWAFGMLVFEIFNNGEKPWIGWEDKKIATYIRRGHMVDLPDTAPQIIKYLVKDCWSMNIEKRCDFKQISRRITEIQLIYPAPSPNESTISLIPNVTAMSIEEMEVLQENSEDAVIETPSIFEVNPIFFPNKISEAEKEVPTIEEQVQKKTKKNSRHSKRRSRNSTVTEENIDPTKETQEEPSSCEQSGPTMRQKDRKKR